MFKFDPSRLNMVCECVVQALPFFCEVESLEHLKAADLMEANNSPLVKRDEKFATGARLCELDGA